MAGENNQTKFFVNIVNKVGNDRGQGQTHVLLAKVRREFDKRGWNEVVQDKIITKLRAAGVIQLHGGDPMYYSAEDLKRGFTDVYGDRYGTMILYNHKLPTRSAAGSYKRAKKQVTR